VATFDATVLNLVAHEMRAPLAVIRGYLSMLRDGSLTQWPEFERAVTAMELKAGELDDLAGILVTAARLETSNLPLDPTAFDVADAVADAVERVQARAQLDQTEIEVYRADQPLWVIADREQVTRILTNLLNNGLAYNTAPLQVTVVIRATSPIEVAVVDNGEGIAPEHQERVFERFSRFGEGGRNRTAGLGLGLAISRELAELNGGQLLLERSTPGEGSVFALRLPAAGVRLAGASGRG
jgi:signal transduction histidine kinase